MSEEINDLRHALYTATLLRSIERTAVAAQFRKAVCALLLSTKQVELIDGAILIDGQDTDTAVDSWVATDSARVFLAPAGSGNGRTPAAGSIGQKRSTMNPTEKGRFIREHGLEAFQSLPA